MSDKPELLALSLAVKCSDKCLCIHLALAGWQHCLLYAAVASYEVPIIFAQDTAATHLQCPGFAELFTLESQFRRCLSA